MKTNQKKQVAVLVAALVLIVGALLYFYHDALLPAPIGSANTLATPTRLQVPKQMGDKALYERPDYEALESHPEIPVKPVPLNGTGSPFDPVTAPEVR